MRSRFIAVLGCVIGVVFSLSRLAAAQNCDPQWLPGDGVPGTNGAVLALTLWDPDGAGPQSVKVVMGGSFTAVGSQALRGIALHDPTTGEFSGVGSGMNGTVYSLATLASGELVAGGEFTDAGGVTVGYVAKWNGSTWSALGGGLTSTVRALKVMANGDLVAGGLFNTAGGVRADYIARWDGTSWHAMGQGVNAFVLALTTRPKRRAYRRR